MSNVFRVQPCLDFSNPFNYPLPCQMVSDTVSGRVDDVSVSDAGTTPVRRRKWRVRASQGINIFRLPGPLPPGGMEEASSAASSDGRDEEYEEDYDEAGGGNRLLGFMFGNVDCSGGLDVDYLDELTKSSPAPTDISEQDYDEKAEDSVDYEDIDEQYDGPETQSATEEDHLLPKGDHFLSDATVAVLNQKASVFDEENYDEDEEPVKEDAVAGYVEPSSAGPQEKLVPVKSVAPDDIAPTESADAEHMPFELEDFQVDNSVGVNPVEDAVSQQVPIDVAQQQMEVPIAVSQQQMQVPLEQVDIVHDQSICKGSIGAKQTSATSIGLTPHSQRPKLKINKSTKKKPTQAEAMSFQQIPIEVVSQDPEQADHVGSTMPELPKVPRNQEKGKGVKHTEATLKNWSLPKAPGNQEKTKGACADKRRRIWLPPGL